GGRTAAAHRPPAHLRADRPRSLPRGGSRLPPRGARTDVPRGDERSERGRGDGLPGREDPADPDRRDRAVGGRRARPRLGRLDREHRARGPLGPPARGRDHRGTVALVSVLAIVAFFVALLAIILIHEFGHYLVARRFGFRVLEYFVGFGPKLWSFRRGEIEYGLKAIPAGGYVKIAGMNPFENDIPPGDEDRAYGAKPVWQRALVILAGPFSHFLVAALIFSVLLMTTGETDRTRVSVIAAVPARLDHQPSPAAVAGLQPGDIITRIGDRSEEHTSELQSRG